YVWIEQQIPYNYTGGYEATSSDPSVVTADICMDEYMFSTENPEERVGSVEINAHKSGTAVITISGGGVQKSFTVNVNLSSIYVGDDEMGIHISNTLHSKTSEFDQSKFSYSFDEGGNGMNVDVEDWDADYDMNYATREKDHYVNMYLNVWASSGTEHGTKTLRLFYDGKEFASYEVNVVPEDDY
ncbi:MAG: hypothetical protein IJL75_03805, partial [Eubacterium sp.]|nr:hypothetical protein [Eubacterium sp.]